MLTPAARRQILEHMGIDVWRPRVAAGALSETAAEPAVAAPRPDVPPHPDVQRQPPAPPASLREPRPTVEARPSAAPAQPSQPAAAAARPALTLSVLSLSLGGAIMLIEGSPSRPDRRLAMDVLSAACGDWRTKPSTRRFDWPPAGGLMDANPDAPLRALEAFVDKDVADHQVRLLLCSESLSARLSSRWPGCRLVVIPPLDLLGRDAALKRALWQAMQRAEP